MSPKVLKTFCVCESSTAGALAEEASPVFTKVVNSKPYKAVKASRPSQDLHLPSSTVRQLNTPPSPDEKYV